MVSRIHIHMLSASVEILPQFQPLWTVILVNTDIVSLVFVIPLNVISSAVANKVTDYKISNAF